MKAVFDSDILIDLLQGHPRAAEAWHACTRRQISVISTVELLSGADNGEEREMCRKLFDGFQVLPITPAIAERAAGLRRTHRLKLPDAVIWASALEHGSVLLTRNAKAFPTNDATVRIPYKS